MRGTTVNESYQATQQSFDDRGIGMIGIGAASGMGDLTREQVKAMARARNIQFARQVGLMAVALFGLSYVALDFLAARGIDLTQAF